MYIRNKKGEFVKAKTIWKEASIPSLEADALGLYEAIQSNLIANQWWMVLLEILQI